MNRVSFKKVSLIVSAFLIYPQTKNKAHMDVVQDFCARLNTVMAHMCIVNVLVAL